MGAWEIVEQDENTDLIQSTWAFECKSYPDGLLKKFKSRFYTRGDQQLGGLDFFETYAPFVQCTMV